MANDKKKRSKASDFKKGKVAIDLELPSGNVCLAKRKTLDVFLSEGIIPNSLMGIVQQQLNAAENKDDALQGELQKLASDPEKLKDVMALSDAVVIAVVLEPKVNPKPASEEERDEDLLYVDEVDMDDKMFIFQWAVGGTASVERFREERSALVADLSGGEAVGS